MLILENHVPFRNAKLDDTSYGGSNTVRSGTLLFGDSLADVVNFVTSNQRKWRTNNSRTGSVSFCGATWEQTLIMARDGWEEGTKNLYNELIGVLPAQEKTARYKYDVGGDAPDVARFLGGDPANMRSRGKSMGRRPVIHIAVNLSVSGGTSTKSMQNYGVALTALVDQLEHSGRRVELDVVSAGLHPGSHASSYGWNVKKAEDALDLSAVAFSIGHPAAFRRLCFALLEFLPAETDDHGGYGRCSNVTPAHFPDGDTEALLIDGLGHGNAATCSTKEGALKLAAAQINKAAGEELVTLEE